MLDDTITPALAYDYAVATGHLTKDVTSPFYVGNHVFIGTDITTGHYVFKEIITRTFLRIPRHINQAA